MATSTLTIGDWTGKTYNGVTTWNCTVTATVADYDLYTKKTPDGLDPHKPWTLIVNSAEQPLMVRLYLWIYTQVGMILLL